MTQLQLPDVLRDLYAPYAELLVKLPQSLYRDDDHDAVNLKLHAMLQAVTDLQAVSKSRRSEPASRRSIALIYRVVERGLCLVALVNSKNDANEGRYFSSAIVDGYRVLRDNFSGPVHWPDMLRARPVIEPRMLGAVLQDNMALVTELGREVGAPTSEAAVIQAGWEALGTDLQGFLKSLRSSSRPTGNPLEALDELLTAEEFARAFRKTASTLQRLASAGKVLALPSWDGQHVYPAFQVLDNGLPKKMDKLIAAVDLTRLSRWHLAYWLAHPRGDGDPRRIELLDTDAGLHDLLSELRRFRVLRDTPASTTPTPLRESDVRAYLANGGGASLSQDVQLYRVTRRQYGAFFFSSGIHRFDPPLSSGSSRGTCYFALTKPGAFEEVLNRSPVVEIDQLLDQHIWSMRPARDLEHLVDLTDEAVCQVIQYDAANDRNSDRLVTQGVAATIERAGALGIEYFLVERNGAKGIALFGPSGMAPAEAMNPPQEFLQVREALVEDTEFWRWLSEKVESRHCILMPFQTPLESGGIQLRPRKRSAA